VASDGEPLSVEGQAWLTPGVGIPVPTSGQGDLRTVVLSASGRPVGILGLAGPALGSHQRQLLVTFANHAALAVKRAQLQEQTLRTTILEEVDRWRSALLASVSHDLRTPLFSIKASVSNLLDPEAPLGPGDRQELLTMIEAETDRLARLVADLLDMTRIEAGTLKAQLQPVAVQDLVDDVLRRLPANTFTGPIEAELPPDLPLVLADPVLSGQVLFNLLENAARYASSGSPIELRAALTAGSVALSVVDGGPGIPPGERQAIFEAFHRIGASCHKPQSQGLGLAIAKAFVEAQRGTIGVEDNPSGGSVFTVSLPVFSMVSEVV
jgi:two-component system sensor histidine kinase KdpD